MYECVNGHRNLTPGDCVYCGQQTSDSLDAASIATAATVEQPDLRGLHDTPTALAEPDMWSTPAASNPSPTLPPPPPPGFGSSTRTFAPPPAENAGVAALGEGGQEEKRIQFMGRVYLALALVVLVVVSVIVLPPTYRKAREITTGRSTYTYENYEFSIELANAPEVEATGRFSDSLLQVVSVDNGNIIGLFVLERPTADTVTSGSISRAAEIFMNDPTAVSALDAQVRAEGDSLIAEGTYLVRVQGAQRSIRTHAVARDRFTYVVFASAGDGRTDSEVLNETLSRIEFD